MTITFSGMQRPPSTEYALAHDVARTGAWAVSVLESAGLKTYNNDSPPCNDTNVVIASGSWGVVPSAVLFDNSPTSLLLKLTPPDPQLHSLPLLRAVVCQRFVPAVGEPGGGCDVYVVRLVGQRRE